MLLDDLNYVWIVYAVNDSGGACIIGCYTSERKLKENFETLKLLYSADGTVMVKKVEKNTDFLYWLINK